MSRCRICGRVLKNPAHAAAGIGPVCAAKQASKLAAQTQDTSDIIFPYTPGTDIFIERVACLTQQPGGGLAMERHTASGIKTNVQRLVTRHSPSGFNFGYGGSGPADLALNICKMFVLNPEHAEGVYQEFKWQFCNGQGENGRLAIPARTIVDWLLERQIPVKREHITSQTQQS